MNTQMLLSTILITLALVAYTVGVWGERLAGRLLARHLAFFWAGLASDTSGTGIMFEMAKGGAWSLHGLTGLAAIVLMLIHALWATVVLVRNEEKAIVNFHRFSVVVWAIWLIPYSTGLIASMNR